MGAGECGDFAWQASKASAIELEARIHFDASHRAHKLKAFHSLPAFVFLSFTNNWSGRIGPPPLRSVARLAFPKSRTNFIGALRNRYDAADTKHQPRALQLTASGFSRAFDPHAEGGVHSGPLCRAFPDHFTMLVRNSRAVRTLPEQHLIPPRARDALRFDFRGHQRSLLTHDDNFIAFHRVRLARVSLTTKRRVTTS